MSVERVREGEGSTREGRGRGGEGEGGLVAI